MLQNFPKAREICKLLFPKFMKIHPVWSHKHTQIVMHFKSKVNSLPYLGIPNSYEFMIDVSDNSLSTIRILKECLNPNPELLARFHNKI